MPCLAHFRRCSLPYTAQISVPRAKHGNLYLLPSCIACPKYCSRGPTYALILTCLNIPANTWRGRVVAPQHAMEHIVKSSKRLRDDDPPGPKMRSVAFS